MSSALRRLAASAQVPVYPITGVGMRQRVQALRLVEGITLVDTPRAANILLVAGAIGPAHHEALARVHDALPHPRATLLWNVPTAGLTFGRTVRVEASASPVPAARALFRALLDGSRPTEEPLLPAVDPVEWRGVGPYGQGGSGMTGGTPYGRPMAELGPDRDGLRLDVLPVELGPCFARLPTGLVLDLRVAGDVVVGASVTSRSLDVAPSTLGGIRRSPFLRALTTSVPIAELETARAQDHMRWLADALHAAGLRALGLRALGLAGTVRPGDGRAVRDFGRMLDHTGLYHWSLGPARNVGAETLAGLSLGPVSRAAGLREDVRLVDPGYHALRFEPVIMDAGDLASRWRIRIEEAAAALDLAGQAGATTTALLGQVESPRGRLSAGDAPTDRALALIPQSIEGLEWSMALATITSLDLDLEESAFAAAEPAAVAA